ncbi:MAG TPA: hypothetical protein VKA54_01855 [Gemmatimonadaceae bacterium]|nr:hypothetical protein [Gemmatimonadaceae bacterium]
MRHADLVHLLLAGVLVCGTACSDALAPPRDESTSTGAGEKPPPSANATIGYLAREIPVNGFVLLQGPLVSQSTHMAIGGPITWASSDPLVAQVVPLAGSSEVIRVKGAHAGTAVITATAQGNVANVTIRVLELTAAASPVVIDDFYALELGSSSEGWSYAPQLVLHDATAGGGAAVIGLSIDLPGAGPSPRCAMLRPIGSQPTELFHESYGDPELTIGKGGYRVPPGEMIVAHLTLRVPGPLVKELTLMGRVVPGDWPTTYTPDGWTRDVLSCG